MIGRERGGKVIAWEEGRVAPRGGVAGWASCCGGEWQITNAEAHLRDVVGQFDLRYWQVASSEPMPDEFDVAIIEGAVTTEEAEATVRMLRDRARVLIAIGACATTAGIPGMAADHFLERPGQVYDRLPDACGDMIAPRPISAVADVDYEVRCCPIDTLDFLDVLQRALYGSNKGFPTKTMCGDCKRNESSCFFGKGQLCLGLVTTAGCGAKCVNLGRPCNGCRGLSRDANLASAREAVARYGVSVEDFDQALEMFNQTNPALAGSE